MKMLRFPAILCAAGMLCTPRSYAVTGDDIHRDAQLRAMIDELGRSKTLQLNNLEKPYFISYTIDDPEQVYINASLGGLLSSTRGHFRRTTVQVRVGDAKFDNTNSLFSGDPQSVSVPIEDNYHAIRTELWLATDALYKSSVEQMNRKKTALREIADPDKTPDLAPAKPVQILEPIPSLKIDQKHWEQVIQKLSGQFAAHPSITFSSVRLRAISSTFRLVNSEGTVVRVPEELCDIDVRAKALAADGSYIWNHHFITVLHPGEFPNEEQLSKSVEAVAAETEALTKAPLAEEYSGPVLFEQEAAAEMMAQVLAEAVRIQRKPLTPPELSSRAPRILDSVWAMRLGSKVMPEWLTIFDNPAETHFQDTVLAGQFNVDEEGVPAQRITLVEKGTLKTMLTTRQPVGEIAVSTGHGRLPGYFGAEQAVFGNVFIQAEQTISEDRLKARLIEMVKKAGLKYGILIRRLDFPSTASGDELENIGSQLQKNGVARTLTAPLLAYRVYPDGREELVRGARFKDFSAKDLRDLEAASDRPYVLNYVNNGTSYNFADAPLGATTSSVICPSLLFYSIDLDSSKGDAGKPPTVPPPAIASIQ
jgi:predicted Zn-dependent protease